MLRTSRRQLLKAFSAAAVVPVVARAERKVIANEAFEVDHVEVTLANLHDSHDGLRVVQLSDLHIGNDVPDGRIISAVREVNALKPDVVVLTGDFVTTRRDPVDRVQQLLEPLEAPSFAVLGNHDHWSHPKELRRALEKNGTAVLQNENSSIRLRAAELRIIGIDDSTTRHHDVSTAFQGATGGSRLVLTHTPACAAQLPVDAGLLCLSGHTHGGQWEIPGVTHGILQRFGQPWYRGQYAVRGNQLYVNRGLGFGKGTRLPRINSDPEVTVITLRKAV